MMNILYDRSPDDVIKNACAFANFYPWDGHIEHIENAAKIDVVIARQRLLTKALFDQLENVRWVQILNSGYEMADIEAMRQKKCLVTNARSIFCDAIAEDVIAKILIMARGYTQYFDDQQKRRWSVYASPIELSGKTLAVIGAGRIGCAVATRAHAFDMRVLAYDKQPIVHEHIERVVQTPEALQDLLCQCDFVVLCIPTTVQTTGLINKKMLSHMKPSAFLINVARGDIVVENDLVEVLQKGQIKGAAVDVVQNEPPDSDHPFWSTPNLLITPHQAAYGDQLTKKRNDLLIFNISAFKNEQPLMNIVDLDAVD